MYVYLLVVVGEIPVAETTSYQMLRLIAFSTCLIRLLGAAFSTLRLARYKEFVKQVGRTIRWHCVCLTKHVKEFLSLFTYLGKCCTHILQRFWAFNRVLNHRHLSITSSLLHSLNLPAFFLSPLKSFSPPTSSFLQTNGAVCSRHLVPLPQSQNLSRRHALPPPSFTFASGGRGGAILAQQAPDRVWPVCSPGNPVDSYRSQVRLLYTTKNS